CARFYFGSYYFDYW
nr:immunoglobulin heavy chain junction region [Mus musculus]